MTKQPIAVLPHTEDTKSASVHDPKSAALPEHKAPPLSLEGTQELLIGDTPSSDFNARHYFSKASTQTILSIGLGSVGLALAFTGAIALSFFAICTAIAAGCYTAYRYHMAIVSTLSLTKHAVEEKLEKLEDQTWELKESEERYRSLSEMFGDLVMHRTQNGTITFINPAFEAVLNKSAAEIIGNQFDQKQLSQIENDQHLDGPGKVQELKLELGEQTRWYSWLELPFRDEKTGKTIIRSIARDITEHKNTVLALRRAGEKAELGSTAKSRFLASVSHEMRTPLNGILGMSDLLSDTDLTPDQVTYNKAVHTSGAALLILIEDILDFARIEANHFQLKSELFSPYRLTENITELLSVKAHAKGIGLSCYFDSCIPKLLRGDEGRLRQVVINLLGNAIKFTENGEVCIRVRKGGSPKDQATATLRFEIEDTGPGMEKKDTAKVFGEFVQVDAENTRKHGGAGLGLAISQGIIQQMGGQITIESVPKVGSIFAFEVTLPTEGIERSEVVIPGKLKGKSIQVISGACLEAEALKLTIEDASGRASICPTLTSAYSENRDRKKSKQHHDYIVLDESISRDPLVSLRKLRQAAGFRVPAVIMVTPDNRKYLDKYLGQGFDAFLIKPTRPASLVAVLNGETICERDEDAKLKDANERALVSSRPIRILLAEDNDINALLAKSVLKKSGHEITRAVNGKLAVSEYRQAIMKDKPFDLVLMDLHMPVMDGLDAVTRIRAFEKAEKIEPVRIVILTADEQSETRLDSMMAGADGYLTKPFVPARLIELARDVGENTIKR